MKNPIVMQMVGQDGNAFAILGRFSAAARKAGWTPEEIKEVHDDATSGDYGHLLYTIMQNIEEPEAEEDEDENQIKCFNCRERWSAYDICDECENCPDCCECDSIDDEDEED